MEKGEGKGEGERMREERFDLENLPEGWKRVRLREVASFKNGKSPRIVDDGVYSVYGSNGLIGYANEYLLDGIFILIGRVGASGETHLVQGKLWVSDNCLIGQCKADSTPIYMYYLLKHLNLPRFITQTAQPLITQSLIANLEISLPPLPEQRKIAEILETVDNAIEKTDKIIEKYKRIKQGMMQDLLTKGVKVDGEGEGESEGEGGGEGERWRLRDEKIDKFKDSPLGRIPEEWEVVELGEVLSFKNGINFSVDEREREGILTLDVLNMYSERIIVNFENVYRVNKQIANSYILKDGDILFVRSSVKREGVGWTSLFKNINEDATFCGFIIRGRPIREVSSVYMTYYMRSEFGRKALISKSGQLAITNINQKMLSEIFIFLPPLPEQHCIASILSQIDETIEKEQAYKEKLERIKQGLMEDLLTGRVRSYEL